MIRYFSSDIPNINSQMNQFDIIFSGFSFSLHRRFTSRSLRLLVLLTVLNLVVATSSRKNVEVLDNELDSHSLGNQVLPLLGMQQSRKVYTKGPDDAEEGGGEVPSTHRFLQSQSHRPWLHLHHLRKESNLCWSRSEKHLYKSSVSNIKPSSALVDKIAAYLKRYQKCWHGPTDWPYVVGDFHGREIENFHRLDGCTYAMVDLSDGLGNRLLGFVSIFIWALLTDRVLLVSDPLLEGTLCDFPAPETSWWAPEWQHWPDKVPYAQILSLHNVTGLEVTKNEGPKHVAWVEVSHRHEYSDGPSFFCEETQLALQQHVKTVTMQSNQFFATGLWLVPSMADKLLQLFPDRVLFRPIAHYILNPNNLEWDRITRMYRSNHGDSEERVGMQIRTRLEDDTGVPPVVLGCAVNISRVLPPPSPLGTWARELHPSQQKQSEIVSSYLKKKMPKMTSVFIASLNDSHAQYLHQRYSDGPAEDGTYVVIRSESIDTSQDDSLSQAQRAFAEMWLLSLSDKLLISAGSTFGYISAGLADCQTYMLDILNWKPSRLLDKNRTLCYKLVGRDPCFHFPPHILECRKPITLRETFFSPFKSLPLFPFFQRCLDMPQGIVVV